MYIEVNVIYIQFYGFLGSETASWNLFNVLIDCTNLVPSHLRGDMRIYTKNVGY